VNVYVFNSGGSYVGIHDQTDSSGDVSFELPVGDYKFRADYNGTQYWSEIETIVADQTINVSIDIQTASQSFLDRHRISQIPGDEVYYYHNDHLGTPQKMTNSIGTVVWEADYLPFGKAMVDEDPDGDGVDVVNNIRFPGQYYDEETGLHYNWHRDYKPEIGRYIERDPIGIEGGLNLYTYVLNNPVNFDDPLGLLHKCKSGLSSRC